MQEPFFSPETVLWRVHRETVLVAVGGRALLMQLAHPKVAAGVADHSGFRQDPLKRLQRTLAAMWSIVFDDSPDATASLARVKAVHQRVQGTHVDSVAGPVGYRALDPALMLWVHATLVDSALLAYDRFLVPLSAEEKARYYDETRKLAALFDIPESVVPESLAAFGDYMAGMLEGGEIKVSATARLLSRAILAPEPWLLRPIRPLFAFVTAGLLPPELRDGYGLSWNERRERWLCRLATLTRGLMPLIPAPLRFVPNARASEKRLRATGQRL